MRRAVFRGTLVSVGLLAVVLTAADPTGAAPESPDPRPLGANVTGDLVIGPSGARGIGDPDGTGKVVVARGRAGEVCVSIVVNRTEHPSAAHIHVGEPGSTGSAVATLSTPRNQHVSIFPPSRHPGFWSSACVSLSADVDVASDVFHRPYRYYVDVHTPTHPDGAIRSQLGHALAVSMNILETDPFPRFGSTSWGVGLVAPGPRPDQLCASVEFGGLDPATALHIHRDTGAEPHPVAIVLPTPLPNTSGGCVEAHPATVTAVLTGGSVHYLHVHTESQPDGALRGRIPNNFGP